MQKTIFDLVEDPNEKQILQEIISIFTEPSEFTTILATTTIRGKFEKK